MVVQPSPHRGLQSGGRWKLLCTGCRIRDSTSQRGLKWLHKCGHSIASKAEGMIQGFQAPHSPYGPLSLDPSNSQVSCA